MNKIKEIREQKGMTQKDLGDALGLDRGLISRYENGSKNPKLDRLKQIAKALGVSYLDLIDDIETEEAVIKYVKHKWNIDLEPLK